MSVARGEFYPAIRVMMDLATEPLLMDKGPGDVAHNLSAGALRRGLAVNSFALLETYLEARTEELLIQLASCPLGYAAFSNELQGFITLNAALGLANKIGHADKSQKLPLAETGIRKISGYSTNPPTYTAFGFSTRGSNIYKDDVSNCLKALGLAKPWDDMKAACSAIGSTRLNIGDDFDNISRTRHSCAHNSRSSIPTSDLQTHLECVILIGLGFDVLATSLMTSICATRRASDLPTVSARAKRLFRFLDQQIDDTWVERAEVNGRNVKNYSTELLAKAGAIARSNSSSKFHIVRNIQQIPIELF